jgi:hypothetical protein
LRRTGDHTATTTARVCFALATIAIARSACAADVSEYVDSAAGSSPRGNAGFVVSSDWVQLKADVALRTQSGGTEVVPNLRSKFDLGARVGVEARVDLGDRNGNDAAGMVKTRVHYDPPPQFLESVDGVVWRSPDGQTGEKLDIAFRKVIGAAARERPITIRGRAGVESTFWEGAAPQPDSVSSMPEQSRRYSFETEVRGLLGSLARGKSALRLKIERLAGAHVESAKSLAYNYSWTVRNFAQLGFNVGMRSATEEAIAVLEPSLGLTLKAKF